MGPYILKLAKVIKYAAPVAGAAAGVIASGPGGGVVGVAAAKKLAAQIKLMEELAKKLAERDYMEVELLSEIAPKEYKGRQWGTLRRVRMPDNTYRWLCKEHAEEYKK